MDQKQSDVLTILHLIKSEGEKTRNELETKMSEGFAKQRKELESKMVEGFAKQRNELETKMSEGFSKQRKLLTKELKEYIDEKVETLRRNIVDDVQIFQDAVITEVREIRQETSVNTSHRTILTDHETRLSKVEKHLFTN